MQYAAGHLVGRSGRAAFAGHRSEGNTRACAASSLRCNALLDPTGAFIHLIVRDHGRAMPGSVDQQIHSFDVCNPTCTDVQFSPHEQRTDG